ncbi:Serpin domain-containing protein [Strongyloides ratti]|uniref:Serpin domain-containing protein n=1 Tax=Strongyloides ratti TaxID=34506 RepID=A0A090LF66_STRRB|nr:Serpin domain-containing protein [Strongyloides ratti]CEF66768.1 Serpin domain-containing protein [Strongyloides ratti]
MHKQSYLPYAEDFNFHFIQIPYSDENFSFVILLPKIRNKLKSFLKKVNGKQFLSLLRKSDIAQVNLDIPKFKIESSQNYVQLFKNMGLMTPFKSSEDYSLITSKMLINQIRQKSRIEISERGTGVTKDVFVKMLPLSDLFPIHSKKIAIRVDHPFLFFVLYKEQILLNGIYQ